MQGILWNVSLPIWCKRGLLYCPFLDKRSMSIFLILSNREKRVCRFCSLWWSFKVMVKIKNNTQYLSMFIQIIILGKELFLCPAKWLEVGCLSMGFLNSRTCFIYLEKSFIYREKSWTCFVYSDNTTMSILDILHLSSYMKLWGWVMSS